MTIIDEKQAEIDEYRTEIHHLEAKLDDALDIVRKAERMLMYCETSDERVQRKVDLMQAITDYTQTYGGLN